MRKLDGRDQTGVEAAESDHRLVGALAGNVHPHDERCCRVRLHFAPYGQVYPLAVNELHGAGAGKLATDANTHKVAVLAVVFYPLVYLRLVRE